MCNDTSSIRDIFSPGQNVLSLWNSTTCEEAEEELRAMIEAIPQFIWTARPDGYVTYNNQRLIDYLALTHAQAEGDGWMDSVHPAERQQVWDAWHFAVRMGEPYEVEHRLQDGRSGEYHWFLVRGVPRKDAQGIVQSWIGTCTDIDQQKKAEEDIKASEQQLRALAETVPQLVWTTLPDGRLDYANQRFCSFIQVGMEHLRDYGWRHFLHPEDLEPTLSLRQRSLESGALYECEYRLRDGHTGEYRWFLARALPVYDDAGQITRWFGTGTDIDEQKRTESALRQNQEHIQALMNSNAIGIFCAEEDTIVQANSTFLQMTGYSQQDLQQRQVSWSCITPPTYHEMTQQTQQQVAFHHYFAPYEKEYICKDGSRLPVLVGGVVTQCNPLQTICFVLDNSAHKALEQRKDDFLSMASHELRTPLTALKLQTQMLRKQLARQNTLKADDALARMERQLNAVTRLVSELFDLSKIQAGQLEYAQEVVDLHEVLQETVEVMQQTQTTHTIVVSDPGEPVFLIGDRDRFGQVLLNLLSNAIKYSPDAQQIEVSMTTSTEEIVISIRDHGIGIPREQQGKIFERFYRAVSPQQRAFPGMGIGLSIVGEVVKHHSGTITLESEMGAGSTFHVTLPRTSASLHPMDTSRDLPLFSRMPMDKRKIHELSGEPNSH